jgi:predicted MPP superfamily phosphohydrolase
MDRMEITAWVFAFLVLLGHTQVVIFAHNRFYGLPLGHKTIDLIQFIHFLWLLLGPLVLWFLWSGQIPNSGTRDPEWLRALLWGFATLGLLGPPIDLFLRARRRRMSFVSHRAPIASVQAEDPRELAGTGTWARIARLPGNRSLRPVLDRAEVSIVGLPKVLDGLTILHLSDLHVQKTPNALFFERVAEELAAYEPDLICLTGDLVEKGGTSHAEVFRAFLQKFKFREAGLAILGNHDFWHPIGPTLKVLSDLGYQHLGNQRRTVRVRGTEVSLWGLEYPWNPELPQGWNQRLGEWTLCLSHTPDHFPMFAKLGSGLMLAGHVHGGQIRFPVIGPIIMPSVHGRKFDQGWFRRKNAYLHVSQGLSAGHPLRFGCSPGASLITLRCANES